jgi:hypothetical protein
LKPADRKIFINSACNNKGFVVLHAVAGTTVIGATVGFAALLALYFGIDMFRIDERFPNLTILNDKTDLILLALVVSGVLLIARIFQATLEAYVMISREKWFAERIRRGDVTGVGNIARASNYYGRLSAASMNAASTIIVIVINIVTMLVVLPRVYLVGVLAIAMVCSLFLYGAMKLLSVSMAASAEGLASSGRAMGAWKTNRVVDYNPCVDLYYRSYFRRVLLASSFSIAPAIFGPVFCLALLAAQEFGLLTVNLGELFVAFTMLQAYLNIAGKFFGAFVHGSAFLPAVRPYLSHDAASSGDNFVVEDELLQ